MIRISEWRVHLAATTIRRRLRYIRTRRTLWKLTGRNLMSPSRCRQELNPQIQDGTQRRRWSTDCRLRTNGKQLDETIMRVNEMFKGTTNLLQMQQLCLSSQASLDAFRLVIEQLSQFYKTSAEVTVEMIQYTADSTYIADQEEWTRIEGLIQSEFERIIQETHAVEKGAQEAFILAEGTALRSEVAANGSKR